VNPGGEPERDDTGLPPVDIEIPDDARDLDRDVQAYRRELRALRRTERRGRLHRSMGKDGVVLPLLACCLILALITGTLLTVFTATSNQSLTGLPGSPSTASTKSGPKLVPSQPLPDATLAVGGSALETQQLDEAMVVLVPANCRCTATFNLLAQVATKAHVPDYVIYTPATEPEVNLLDNQLTPKLRGAVQLASATGNALSSAQAQAGIAPNQLSAMLVGPDSLVTWVSQLSPRDSQPLLVQVLTGKSV
jgi:hypothetical protein